MLNFEPADAAQESVWSRSIADMDIMFDHRLSRLKQAQEKPSSVLIVVFFGYLVTMVLFGVYRPRRVLVGMIALFTTFVGSVIYLIHSMGRPFQGASVVDPEPIAYVLETMLGNM